MRAFRLFVLSVPLFVAASTVPMQKLQTVATLPDQSVTWQNNAVHDGYDPSSPLTPPLTLKWQKNLAAMGVVSISYPIITDGLIIVTTTNSSSTFNKSVIVFDEATGTQLWSKAISGTYGFLNAAYDGGKIAVVNFDGLLQIFDAATGTPGSSVKLPGQYAFTSPPTASAGIVYVGGAGSGGTLYAVNENNGNVLWTGSVQNGDHSSPAVVPGEHVFVSYACPQSYAFDPQTGLPQWHYSGPCSGGGGKTPVFHLNRVYVRDSFFSNSTNGLILDASTGANVGSFASDRPPALAGNLGVYLQSGTLRGVDVSTGQVLWSFATGDLQSAPLIVNQTIYIGGSSGTLYALDFGGHQIWSTSVGAAIPAPDEQNATLTTGLGAGDGLLVVPAGATLAVYGGPTPVAQSAISRKTHGNAGSFDVGLPLSGNPGIECRSGGLTRDYTMVVTFGGNVSVGGSPQAAVTSGTGTVGSAGSSNAGAVTIAGNVVTIPLTNVADAQTINVTLKNVNGSTNVTIPMTMLSGDTNGDGSVNSADAQQVRSASGQETSSANFRSDLNADGVINSADATIVRNNSGAPARAPTGTDRTGVSESPAEN